MKWKIVLLIGTWCNLVLFGLSGPIRPTSISTPKSRPVSPLHLSGPFRRRVERMTPIGDASSAHVVSLEPNGLEIQPIFPVVERVVMKQFLENDGQSMNEYLAHVRLAWSYDEHNQKHWTYETSASKYVVKVLGVIVNEDELYRFDADTAETIDPHQVTYVSICYISLKSSCSVV